MSDVFVGQGDFFNGPRDTLSGSSDVFGGGGSGPVAPLDGEVTSSAQILSIVANNANAGKSYYMRGGNYGDLVLDVNARPSSLITFITYPGEQVVMNSLTFNSARNIRFDGNTANRIRAANNPTGLPSGQYGLRIVGNGAFTTPGSGNQQTCILFVATFAPNCEGIQMANFRAGDVANSDWTAWRWQHGIIIRSWTYDLLIEDAEIAYLGNDGVSGDFTAGGFGIAWQFGTGEDANAGNYTFRRIHVHHVSNDAVQYAGGGVGVETRFEQCLFAPIEFAGANHTDALQIVGATQKLTYESCVFETVSQFLLQSAGPSNPRTFHNCLFHNVTNQLEFGKDGDNPPPGDYVIDSCTIDISMRTEGVGTSNNKVRNSVYKGFYTTSGITVSNLWANDGIANIKDSSSTDIGLSSDIVDAPILNSNRECTNHTQGWRKPADFPWNIV